MNSTLARLAITVTSESASIFPALYSSRSTFSALSISAYRLISPFISSFSPIRASICKSTFKSFLSPALFFSSASIYGHTFTTHQPIFSVDLSIMISLCNFIGCSSSRTNGGAINLLRPYSSAFFLGCSFLNCSTSHTGGAIYSLASFFGISHCYFSFCFAAEQSHCIHILVQSKTIQSNITDTVSAYSSPRGFSTIVVAALFTCVRSLNSSSNEADVDSASFYGISNHRLVIAFSLFELCRAPFILRNYGSEAVFNIHYCNIIKNNAFSAIFFSSGLINLYQCVIAENTAQKAFSGDNFTLQLLNCFCDTEVIGASAFLRNFRSGADFTYNRLFFGFSGIPQSLKLEEDYDYRLKPLLEGRRDASRYFNALKIQVNTPTLHPTNTISNQTEVPQKTLRTEMPTHEYSHEIDRVIIPLREKVAKINVYDEIEVPTATKRSRKRSIPAARPTFARTKKTTLRTTETPIITATFSTTPSFTSSRTFTQTKQFTASQVPIASTVPIVLYATAGFVLGCVFVAFFFMKPDDRGYNIIFASESAEAKADDAITATTDIAGVTESSAEN